MQQEIGQEQNLFAMVGSAFQFYFKSVLMKTLCFTVVLNGVLYKTKHYVYVLMLNQHRYT